MRAKAGVARGLAFSVGVAALVLGSGARAHEAIDPVCGMVVDADNPPAVAEYGGVTYYFCIPEDKDAFLADPKRYLAALSARRLVGDGRLGATVTPETPRAGDLVRIVLALDDQDERGGLERADATLFYVDRHAPTLGREVALHALPDGSRACQRTLDRPGEWRLWVVGKRGGEPIEAVFAIPVGPAAPPPEAPRPARRGEPVPMAEQHQAMRRMGAEWARAGAAIERGTPREAEKALDAVAADAARIPGFSLHHHPQEKAELDRLAASFEAALADLARDVRRGAREPARERYLAIDKDHCTRCHVKFRWALTDDLTGWPTLRPAALGAAETDASDAGAEAGR